MIDCVGKDDRFSLLVKCNGQSKPLEGVEQLSQLRGYCKDEKDNLVLAFPY